MLRELAYGTAALAVLGTVAPVVAQQVGPNGGMVAGKSSHQTELVVSPTALTVFMLHDGKTDHTNGVSLRAVVQAGGKTTTIALVNQNGKHLAGALAAPLATGAIVVLTGKDHHGGSISARYVIP
jgi:hypothetical protein